MSIKNHLDPFSESELLLILSSSPVGMALSRTDGSFVYVNEAFCRLFGYSADELYQKNTIVTHDADVKTNQRIRDQLLEEPNKPIVIEKSYINKQGKVFLGLLSISVLKKSDDQVSYFIAQVIDISYRKKIEKSADLFRSMINASRDSMFIVDPSTSKIIDVNLQAHEYLGYSYEDALSLKMIDFDIQIKNKTDWKRRIDELREEKYMLVSSDYQHKDGTVFPVEKSMSYLTQNDFEYVLVIVRDITERKKSDELIWRQANFDSLTSLPNRNLFYNRLEHALINSSRNKSRMAILSVDLDKFKEVNDTFGHAVGDKLLVEVGVRLSSSVRKSDTVARIGGDEFSILMDNIDEVSRVDRIANSILKVLSKRFSFDEGEAYISGSIGIAFFPDDGISSDELMRKSDLAMYTAKNNGRACFKYYESDME